MSPTGAGGGSSEEADQDAVVLAEVGRVVDEAVRGGERVQCDLVEVCAEPLPGGLQSSLAGAQAIGERLNQPLAEELGNGAFGAIRMKHDRGGPLAARCGAAFSQGRY